MTRRIYVMVALLIPLVMLSFGSAQAGTPAAKLIGAYSDNWPLANSTIGPLQTNKFFYQSLPASYADTASNGQPGCGAKDSSGNWIYPPSQITCIIVYDTADTNLQQFIQSIPAARNVIIGYCNEPEGTHNHPNECGSGAGIFKTTFEDQSAKIHQYDGGASNIKIAEVSEAYQYDPGTDHDNGGQASTGCPFIVPSQSDTDLNFYLIDIYEPNLTSDQNLGSDAQWTTWVGCTTGQGLSRGIAEYAILCGNSNATETTPSGSVSIVAKTLADDDTYLKANFPNLALWEYWYTNQAGNGSGCAFTNHQAINEWQAIEAGS